MRHERQCDRHSNKAIDKHAKKMWSPEYNRWLVPSGMPVSLAAGEVNVWRIDIQKSLVYVKDLIDLLSADERERANRYYLEEHRNQFVVCRSALRQMLAQYLNVGANTLGFCYGPYGKPFVSSPIAESIFFNLSHSGKWAIYAFSKFVDVGVDVERIRTVDYLEIGKNIMSPSELRALARFPANLQAKAFFTAWTRKESFVKAIGRGLSFPLSSVEFSSSAEDHIRFLRIEAGQESVWHVHDIDIADGYCASLAIKGLPLYLKLLKWQWT